MQPYFDVIQHRHIGEKADILESAGNAHGIDLRCGFARRIDAVQQNGAAGGLINVSQQIEDSCLACTVGADEPGNFSAPDDQRKIIYCRKATEINAQMPHIQNGLFICIPLGDDCMAGKGNHFCFLCHIQASSLFSFLPALPANSLRTRSFRPAKAGEALSSIMAISTSA